MEENRNPYHFFPDQPESEDASSMNVYMIASNGVCVESLEPLDDAAREFMDALPQLPIAEMYVYQNILLCLHRESVESNLLSKGTIIKRKEDAPDGFQVIHTKDGVFRIATRKRKDVGGLLGKVRSVIGGILGTRKNPK